MVQKFRFKRSIKIMLYKIDDSLCVDVVNCCSIKSLWPQIHIRLKVDEVIIN